MEGEATEQGGIPSGTPRHILLGNPRKMGGAISSHGLSSTPVAGTRRVPADLVKMSPGEWPPRVEVVKIAWGVDADN